MSSLSDTVHRFVEEAGNLTQSLGLGRAVGQMYAYLYFSAAPRNLADMQAALGISKGGASMAVRQLEQWGAARKVWVKGDRKDYYTANEWLGQIARNVLRDTLAKRLNGGGLNGFVASEPPVEDGADAEFVRERLRNLRRFQKKVLGVWHNPLVRALLRE